MSSKVETPHYETRREVYVQKDNTWILAAPERNVNPNIYFVIAHRSWPQTASYVERQDHTAILIYPQPLIKILRIALVSIAQVYEEKPVINANDLFHNMDKLEATLADRLKASKSGLGDQDSTDASSQDDEPISLINGDLNKRADKMSNLFAQSEPDTPKQIALQCKQLETLIVALRELFAPIVAKLERFKSENVITYDLLWALFPVGQVVETVDDISNERMAIKLKSAACQLTRSRRLALLASDGSRLSYNGSRYTTVWESILIAKFKGMRKITSLEAWPISKSHEAQLTARGERYVDLCGERVRFLHYHGSMMQVFGRGAMQRVIRRRAEGRAVCDVVGYRRMKPSDDAEWNDHADEEEEEEGEEEVDRKVKVGVPKHELCLLPPTVFGFSLVQREWGRFKVEGFSPIDFKRDAYDSLVLDPVQKELIRCLVKQYTSKKVVVDKAVSGAEGQEEAGAPVPSPPRILEDFITGKGGGLIIACHGHPGVGKTLTAEAISEVLQVPLYSCGAAELGTTPETLEERLRDIMDTAVSWGAVLLIDEAEVFLTRRDLHNVTRNALVAVFLRALEYFSGVLILTTNRIRDIDPAFVSRFSLAITYSDLDLDKRRAIWTTFLLRAGVVITDSSSAASTIVKDTKQDVLTSDTVERLAKKPLNGRTIKNIARTSLALAQGQGVPLSSDHLFTVLKIAEEFAEGLKDTDEETKYDASDAKSSPSFVYS